MTNIKMQELEKTLTNKKKMPVVRPGYLVRVHQKIKEGEKERVQIFEGLVMGTNSGHGSSKTLTVRKVVEGIGVEKVFPIYSPNVVKIEVKKTFAVRRAKLNYLRKSEGLSNRLKAKLGLIERDEAMTKKTDDATMSSEKEPAVETTAEASAPVAEVATPANDNSTDAGTSAAA